jgi:predicted NBD/HSP70 family sugar kinase
VNSLLLRVPAPLDPDFQPASLLARRQAMAAASAAATSRVLIGLERENGLVSRHETIVPTVPDSETERHIERLLKFLLWAWGGWKVYFAGPQRLGEMLARTFSRSGARAFDVELMERVYERPFQIEIVDAGSVPAEKQSSGAIGGHLDGCRIGFDLGASDYKVAAVREGEVVFSEEFPWSPKDEPDPKYHYEHLNSGLKAAAAKLPRVDAIGGSSAGVIVDNKIMVASLFRSVPAADFGQAKNIFLRLREEWRVPVAVSNDGDVTALAGAMSLKTNGLLGLAMGSSQAAGYIDRGGRMTGWLNELAFAPVDESPASAADEWSGDRGVGALYFSQQAVNKLLPAAGIRVPSEMGLPERLKEVQSLMAGDDPRARRIYETIGVYLGYAIPQYAAFYDFGHLLVLGRVTTGVGGDIVLEKARQVLQIEFPELASKIELHVPDEKMRRVGQAVAAASLPALRNNHG